MDNQPNRKWCPQQQQTFQSPKVTFPTLLSCSFRFKGCLEKPGDLGNFTKMRSNRNWEPYSAMRTRIQTLENTRTREKEHEALSRHYGYVIF